MTVFIDASFLAALFNKDDEFYPKAIEVADKLKRNQVRLLTSNIALGETINLIFRHQGPKAAEVFFKSFKESGAEEIFVADDIFRQAYRRLFAQKSKRGLNLFDCLHLTTMESLGIGTILSFDKSFKKEVKVTGI